MLTRPTTITTTWTVGVSSRSLSDKYENPRTATNTVPASAGGTLRASAMATSVIEPTTAVIGFGPLGGAGSTRGDGDEGLGTSSLILDSSGQTLPARAD